MSSFIVLEYKQLEPSKHLRTLCEYGFDMNAGYVEREVLIHLILFIQANIMGPCRM